MKTNSNMVTVNLETIHRKAVKAAMKVGVKAGFLGVFLGIIVGGRVHQTAIPVSNGLESVIGVFLAGIFLGVLVGLTRAVYIWLSMLVRFRGRLEPFHTHAPHRDEYMGRGSPRTPYMPMSAPASCRTFGSFVTRPKCQSLIERASRSQ